jgi:hypothetical protein
MEKFDGIAHMTVLQRKYNSVIGYKTKLSCKAHMEGSMLRRLLK